MQFITSMNDMNDEEDEWVSALNAALCGDDGDNDADDDDGGGIASEPSEDCICVLVSVVGCCKVDIIV